MHDIYPHPVVPFPPRKIPAAIWSFCEGSGVGFGAGQGLRLEAQGTAGRGLQDPGPWPPNKLCAHGVGLGVSGKGVSGGP